MPDDGSRLSQTKLDENLFGLTYRGRFFVMQPYPFRVVEVDRPPRPGEEALDPLHELLRAGASRISSFRGFGAVELIATTRCNLRCTHCTARSFDGEGDSGFYGLPTADMSLEEMVLAIDHGLNQLRARLLDQPVDRPVFEMFITGGEPLLVWDNLKRALRHARARLSSLPDTLGYLFTPHIVTNGQLIDEQVAAELTDESVVVTVALDSPFNQVRVDAEQKAATPRAIEGVKRLIAAGHTGTSVNVVLDGNEFDQIDSVFSYLERVGAFDGITTVQLSPLAPPIQHTEHAGKGMSSMCSGYRDLSTCDQFSEKLIEYSHRYGVDMKGYGQKLGGWLLQGGTEHRCPVAEWKWCAVPGGDVYACHQLVGIDNFRLGTVHDAGWYSSRQAQSVRQRFRRRTVFETDLCSDCALVAACMVFVDCPARSYLEEGDISRVTPHYCRCGKTYLEKLLGEHVISLVDAGLPAAWPPPDECGAL